MYTSVLECFIMCYVTRVKQWNSQRECCVRLSYQGGTVHPDWEEVINPACWSSTQFERSELAMTGVEVPGESYPRGFESDWKSKGKRSHCAVIGGEDAPEAWQEQWMLDMKVVPCAGDIIILAPNAAASPLQPAGPSYPYSSQLRTSH